MSAVTEAVLGKVMPLLMDVQIWQGGHVGDGVHKQVYAMSCLSDVSTHMLSARLNVLRIGVGEASKWQHSTRYSKMETESLSDLQGHMHRFGTQGKCMTE